MDDQFDKLVVGGSATLGGQLAVSLLDEFEPSLGDEYEIVSAASVVGDFAFFSVPLLTGGGNWGVHYSDSGVTLVITDELEGDYNRDGAVTAADYPVWRNLLGQDVPAGTLADGTGPLGVPDGMVTQLDYDFWKSRYGDVLIAGGSGAIVNSSGAFQAPEPGSLVLLVVGGILALAGWRRLK
jgi:hypothetical protein